MSSLSQYKKEKDDFPIKCKFVLQLKHVSTLSVFCLRLFSNHFKMDVVSLDLKSCSLDEGLIFILKVILWPLNGSL